jgi:thioredoxin 2
MSSSSVNLTFPPIINTYVSWSSSALASASCFAIKFFQGLPKKPILIGTPLLLGAIYFTKAHLAKKAEAEAFAMQEAAKKIYLSNTIRSLLFHPRLDDILTPSLASAIAVKEKTIKLNQLLLQSKLELLSEPRFDVFLNLLNSNITLTELKEILEGKHNEKEQELIHHLAQFYNQIAQSLIESSPTLPKEKNPVIEVTSSTFQKEVIESNTSVLLIAYANWEPKYQEMAPYFFPLFSLPFFNDLHAEGIKIVKFDVDADIPLAKELNITNIPTLLFYKEGKEVARQEGAFDPNTFIHNARKHFTQTTN